MSGDRIAESELVLPSLYLMTQNNGFIRTSALITQLEDILKPQGVDAQILPNRKDTYFSQKVRNLKSHDTLERDGYAIYSDGQFQITSKGALFVENNIESIRYLLHSGFDYDDVRHVFGEFATKPKTMHIPYEEIVVEGISKNVSVKVRERSRKLRDAAIEHFTQNGVIKCDCCGFEFKSFYGPRFGGSCIEIHHIKPIFSYSNENVQKSIEEALRNLLPVCPNCHRVIHKQHITADSLQAFKTDILEQGSPYYKRP